MIIVKWIQHNNEELHTRSMKDREEEKINEAVPLKAKIYDFTPTGNLTITFNKPIILPPIEIIYDQNRRL